MNHIDLQALIQHLHDFVPCSGCQIKFDKGNIYLIASLGMEGLVTAFCAKCNSQSLLEFVLTKVTSPLHAKFVNIRSNTSTKVTLNEILDLRNFLKNFHGDLSEILQ